MSYWKKPLSLGELYDLFSEDLPYSSIKQMEGITLEDLEYIDKLQPKEIKTVSPQSVRAIQRLKNANTESEVRFISEIYFHVFISPYDFTEETTLEEKYEMAYKEALKLWKKYKNKKEV